MGRGRLRVYLGAAPGVGKTYAMLGEGRRRAERGTDVVVGFVETHGREHTAEMLTRLEVVPRISRTYRGTTFEEMDLEAVLARAPEVALVDELAHTNVPGGRHEKRWEDVRDLLDAGIDVITTVNVQHLESVNDVVERITGVPQRETVPDAVVRAADQIELKDMAGEALRRRLAHGNVYAPEKIDAALGNYFRLGNLEALREIALLWLADRVDEALQRYRADHEIDRTWETRERVVVALTGGPEGETLIRRAARIASRAGGELLAVHVARSDGLTGASPENLIEQRRLVESLGGTYHQVLGDPSHASVADSLLAFAQGENATQLVLGDSRRTRLAALFSGPGVGTSTIRSSGDIDVHIVTHSKAGGGRFPRRRGALSRRRRGYGFVLGVVLPALITAALVPLRADNLVTDEMLFLLVTVIVALVGGLWPALLAAVLGSLLLNYFFTPPLHTFTIGTTNNAVALVIFVLVAALVSSVVDLAARRTREATRSAAESRTLADLASAGQTVEALLERLRETFGLESVTLVGSADEARDAQTCVPAGPDRFLALRGRMLEADDQRLVTAFATQLAAVVDRTRLRKEAAEAKTLEAGNKMRTALLAAVGHDLRTPLAAAKASVSSLRSTDVPLSDADRAELLAAADESLDRLAALVDNLLDMSRLQSGAMAMNLQPTTAEEVVARALDALGPAGRGVLVDVPADLPAVSVDPGLVERIIANVVDNALRHSPEDRPPRLTVSALGDRVEVRIIDRGPGIPADDLERVFQPFQRLGDTDNTTGVGLGLALARGLTESMGGSLEPEETPGGGLTMVLSLSRAADAGAPEPGRRERAASGEVVP